MSGISSFIDGTINGAAGLAQGREGTTIKTFVISLAAGFILFAVQFGTFLVIRNYLWAKRIYQPRSFLVPVKQRIESPYNNPFKWLFTVFKIKEDPVVLGKAGMDAYFFLRFLSMCLKIFTPMAIIIMPILIPLNVKQGKGTNTISGVTYNITGLDTLAWSNASPAKTSRYWAHLVMAVGVVVWVCLMFHQELSHYIAKREDFLNSLGHRLKASSTTVLIQDIPEKLCNEEALEELYGDFPGGIRRIWINRDFTTLVNKDKLRKFYENLLENTETNLLRKVARQSHKARLRQRGESTQEAPEQVTPEVRSKVGQTLFPARPEMGPATPAACVRDLEYDLETKAAWANFLTPKQRQTMRIPKDRHAAAARIPLIGRLFSTEVDTIYYCRRELARLNKEIEMDTKTPDAYPKNLSAFVQFNSQKAAHLTCQSVADTSPRHMRRRMVEISPGDINWPSLNLSWRARYLRLVVFLVLFTILLFVFGLISFFTGILSRISTLSGSTSWLKWIDSLPPWLISFIQGTLPPVIQVILLSGPLPILLRLLTNRTRGATTGQEGERSLQLLYFIFLIVELFIIPTISSGLTSIVEELIRTPTSVPNILATNLPTAANYYFSFLILQALSLSATSILQTIRLFKFYVIGHVNTPDSVFEKLSWTNLTRTGSNIPWYTTFAVIGM
jgi:calcium permeable stress-gated cation channel